MLEWHQWSLVTSTNTKSLVAGLLQCIQSDIPIGTCVFTHCIQIPGGWAAQRWGGRRMLMVSFSLWSTASMLTPATAASTSAIMLARVAVGIAQGFLIPSVHTVLSQVPRLCRSTLAVAAWSSAAIMPFCMTTCASVTTCAGVTTLVHIPSLQ